MSVEPVIWQYWETRRHKPPYIDALHDIARRKSGAKVILVTPDNLTTYLPEVPAGLANIEEIAHKADMIRAMLIHRHGGMWLDSDAMVVKDLTEWFSMLDRFEFIGFDGVKPNSDKGGQVKVNCFLAQPNSGIVGEWVRQQHAKLPRTEFSWCEVGSDLLDPIVRKHPDRVKLMPFELVSPIGWQDVELFTANDTDVEQLVNQCHVIMLSNKSLHDKRSKLVDMSMQQFLNDDSLIGSLFRQVLQ